LDPEIREMKEDIVLIGVLKNRRDLNLLLRKKWYRIPSLYAPRRRARFIAFYQPSVFGKSGQRIRYYARIKNCEIVKRKWILPGEPDHIRADEDYLKINLSGIQRLPRPIINKNRTRISFGFTTLKKLLFVNTVMELFDIPPIEEILSDALSKRRIKFSREHIFSLPDGKKYRLDFVIFCRVGLDDKNGLLNIECDGEKWHSIRSQRLKDSLRDRNLRKEGWSILRLKEKDIVNNLQKCIDRIEKKMEGLGGAVM